MALRYEKKPEEKSNPRGLGYVGTGLVPDRSESRTSGEGARQGREEGGPSLGRSSLPWGEQLKGLGLTKTEFGWFFGVPKSTWAGWADEPPYWVVMSIWLLYRNRHEVETVRSAARERRTAAK